MSCQHIKETQNMHVFKYDIQDRHIVSRTFTFTQNDTSHFSVCCHEIDVWLKVWNNVHVRPLQALKIRVEFGPNSQ